MKKAELQINFGFCKGQISGCGMVNGQMIMLCAPNLPSLLRKVIQRHGVPLENITLTFQPYPL